MTADDQTTSKEPVKPSQGQRVPPVMTPDQAYRAARNAEKKKRPDAAETLYRKILAANPEHGKAAHALALLVFRSERMEEAMELFRKAANLQPENPFVHYNLGLVFEHQELFYEAEMAIRRALSLDPEAWKLHRKLGVLLFKQGRHKDAIGAFKRSLELSPDNIGLIGQIGVCYHEAQEYALAEIHYRRVLAAQPDQFDTLVHFGSALVEQDRAEEGADLLSQAVARQPDHARAITRYARALLELDRADEARALYEQCLQSDPDNVDALYGLALVFDPDRDNPRLAKMRELEERLREDPKPLAFLRTALGNAMHSKGEYDAAFAYFDEANRTRTGKAFDALPARLNVFEIVDLFDERMLARTRQPEQDDRVPVFVLGTPRSGKSLVEKLLKCHPEVAGLGENKAFTSALKEVVEEAGLEEDYPKLVGALSDEQLSEVGRRYLKFTRDIDPAKRFIVNTLPGHVRYAGLIAMALPGARLLSVQRDTMDVCVQMFCKHFAHGNEYTRDLERLGAFYAQHRFQMEHWHQLLGERLLGVRYESLVTDTEATWRQIAGHCELPEAKVELPRPNTDFIGIADHYEKHLQPLVEALQSEQRALSRGRRQP